ELKGLAAYQLLRVLVKGKGAYDPPPSLSERVEAAIGLCQLKDPDRDADYDPSVAVYAVGLCFLDFVSEYKKDYVNLTVRTKDPKASKVPANCWRIQSARFKQATEDLRVNTKNTPAQANAQKLARDVGKIADSIITYGPVEESDVLRKMVSTLAPKTGRFYTK